MYKGKNILCVIPARGGSKRLPGKNIKLLNGKPLIAYAIEAAKASKYIDRVIVSTDDQTIAKVAKKYGAEVPFMRPLRLAKDPTPTLPVLQHAVSEIEKANPVNIVVLVQPTSPSVLAGDIDGAIEKKIKENTRSCVSLTTVVDPPEWMFFVRKDRRLQPLLSPRNLLGKAPQTAYRLNGAVYVMERDLLMKKNVLYVPKDCSFILMPRERSIDIDTIEDFNKAEQVFRSR